MIRSLGWHFLKNAIFVYDFSLISHWSAVESVADSWFISFAFELNLHWLRSRELSIGNADGESVTVQQEIRIGFVNHLYFCLRRRCMFRGVLQKISTGVSSTRSKGSILYLDISSSKEWNRVGTRFAILKCLFGTNGSEADFSSNISSVSSSNSSRRRRWCSTVYFSNV